MTRGILVAGAVSFYMSVGVREFPVRYAATSSPRWSCAGVSGAAGHIARTLKTLGDDVRLCTVVGRDLIGAGITTELGRAGLLGPGIVESAESSSGVTLVTPDGRRMGFPHLAPVDRVAYSPDLFEAQARGADLLVLTNAKFVRDLVRPAARLGVPIAVDVHLIHDLGDEYNRPWLEAARIVFCSHERLPCPPERWMAKMFRRYPRCQVVGVGLGERGAVLGMRDGLLVRAEAVTPREVVNTTGAGDALFATFLHVWLNTGDPVRALRAAVVHAGWKVGSRTPVTASLTCEELSRLAAARSPHVVTGRWDPRPPTVRRDVGTA
ncbi:carbohydrate kinase family protein [Streptosporangium sp. NBC_01495]|uniref:carbohydrate kinase family protein n=1 Tax=Streptosporangium sp. NBC_01495 TaxID=2903899 RepID=UPI002E2EA6CF|nr:carbohydrate kinase family protein [Streptosporangium sp. NBC_01495]